MSIHWKTVLGRDEMWPARPGPPVGYFKAGRPGLLINKDDGLAKNTEKQLKIG